ncbi:Xaa-Pro peptidase family protein [Rhizobium sp. YS-1r]|uniref:M24 family metallopeptidase n=1 Tax=Rhizobium sp. YS-1r TaxID=1532558 RepID=UPI00051056C3|nr:Xaa-Pro peptidase family protein [Rhizobium sp. YS-1r]KGE02058.1 hypothetical protein JL39_00515 [Rhizobium sp. YS-1r]
MSDLDRNRAEALMQAAGMDGLAIFQPEAFRYATELDAGVAAMWRRAGACIALVPADKRLRTGAVAADHAVQFLDLSTRNVDVLRQRIWIDYLVLPPALGEDPFPELARQYAAQGLGGARPESFDRAEAFRLLGELLDTRGLLSATIGCDLEFVPAADFAALQEALPNVRFIDGSDVLRRLRMIKSQRELQCLIDASDASEDGMRHMAQALRAGMTIGDLDALWEEGVFASLARKGRRASSLRKGIAVGPDLSNGHARVERGALIKADMGVAIDGYLSDGTRTMCFGTPDPAAVRIYSVLGEAFAAGLEKIRPGNTFGEVHAAVLAVTRRRGMPDYCRGHFGHSIGASCGSEEWPFISAGNREPIMPGMMLAFETPFYGHGLGAMMIEDQVMVTETGAEVINTMPRELVILRS